ncbi:aspartate aminotransferase family protein [Rhizorhabdus wittichii DC-6]|nr:aspartate aminotransferase family protein [Rhizorhabdus wittichii DC-6]
MVTPSDTPIFDLSLRARSRAAVTIPTGVTSAARASALPTPLFVERAAGAMLLDVDGNAYIDYVMGFGPLLLGHTPESVSNAVAARLQNGFLFGAAHRYEAELAERLVGMLPCAEQVLLSNTGSEAVHIAMRLARAATGRRILIKFEGHYHGWFDPVAYGTPGQPPQTRSGAPRAHRRATTGIAPSQPDLLILPWNDVAALEEAFDAHRGEIAGLIMEGIPQAGAIRPLPGYVEAVRRLTERHGALFILDEVITGFRMGSGGIHGEWGVPPDLCVLGKALGAGLPISAVVGRSDVLGLVAGGRTPHMGTFNGHGLCVAAALAALDAYSAPDFHVRLQARSALLSIGLQSAIDDHGLQLKVTQVGALITIVGLPSAHRVDRYDDLAGQDGQAVTAFAEALLRHGVHIQARGTLMPASVHDDDLIDQTIERARRACATIAR